MDRSDNYDALIDALFEGRVDADEAARLLGERGAPEAGVELEELAELVDTLARIDPEIDLPSDAQFGAARRTVLDRIATEEQTPATSTLTHRWLPLAAALMAFAVGLAIGQSRSTPAAPELTLTDLVTRSALASDSSDNFRYSNLRLEEVDADTLAVSVNVESDLRLVRPKNDLLVSDILASSLVSDESLGARLKAVRHAPSNPRVQQALQTVALNDADMSVRLKALERLIDNHMLANGTQDTLLAVLENESSVVMRLLALDALADDHIQPDLLDTLDRNPADEGGNAVLWRAQQRINSRSL